MKYIKKLSHIILLIKTDLNFIKTILFQSHKEFLGNIIDVCLSLKKLITVVLLLPIVFYTVKIQIWVGVLMFCWYNLLFIFYYKILRANYEINCKEVPLNTDYLTAYSIFNVLFFIPQAKAYFAFYNLLKFIYDKTQDSLIKNVRYFLLTLFTFIIIYLVRISIVSILGYSFLTILIVTDFVIKIFDIWYWNFENNKAKYQHILINCFITSSSIVGYVENLNLIIKDERLIFNMNWKDVFIELNNNVKNLQQFNNAYLKLINTKLESQFINGHMFFILKSLVYKDKNITKNLTTSKFIYVINKETNKIEKIRCKDTFYPNLKGDLKDNSLTPSFTVVDKPKLGILTKSTLIKMSNFHEKVKTSFLDDKDEKLLIYKDGKFFINKDSLTLTEYSKEYKLSVYEYINILNNFEKQNEGYLNTEEGRKAFEFYKKILKARYYHYDDENKL